MHSSIATGDGENWDCSTEWYIIGEGHRSTVYGVDRQGVLAMLEERFADVPDWHWQDHVVVCKTRHVIRGLPRPWTWEPRGYDREYYMI